MSMYSVGSNPYTSPEFAPATLLDAQQPSSGLGAYGSSLGYGGDGITNQWPASAIAATVSNALGPQANSYTNPGLSSGVSQNGGAWNSIGALIDQFSSFFQNTISSIGNMIASLGGSSPSASGYGASGNGYGPTPDPYGGAPFGNATFHSVGDPHDAFNGTTSSGTSLNASWDDKHSHGDLISSDSFAGGLRVSTVTTPPIDSNGTRYNESATITSHDGRTQITYNRDGSFYVSNGGQNVPLSTGQAASLGNGESVTLNNDGSLTMHDTNGQGGNVSITLSQSDGGKGVNVNGSANNVDLGGYLANAAAYSPQNPAPAAPPSPIELPPDEPISPLPILPFQYDQSATQNSSSTIPAQVGPPIITAPEETIVDAPIYAPQTVLADLPSTPPAQSATPPAVVANGPSANPAPNPLARFDWLQNARA